MDAMISYLIPSYNHENYLPMLLECIRLDSEYLTVPAEVILVDDGSSDDSPSIIKKWTEANKEHLKVVYLLQKNKGLPAVLNQMIEMAKGEYLRLCASDDIITPGSTQKLYKQFKVYPNLLCALADGNVINKEGRIIHQSSIAFHRGTIKRLKEPDLLVKELIQHWCVAGPTHLIKKSHYNTMRYDETCAIDDYDLFLSLLEIPNSIIFINDSVCSYRIHSTNTSKTKNVMQRIENIKFFLNIVERYINKGILVKYLLQVKYRSRAKIYFLQKKYVRCFFIMCISLFFQVTSELQN
ncbi:glycosyltransferase family 2 protein [Legionella sp.]|uniref:glycosyltransferase family 2 protein n=1 Tax=Legionella sp. TaxID=459 RepID=UPI003CAC63E1